MKRRSILVLPKIPPQSVPPLDNRGGDASLPPLLALPWWLPLNDLFGAAKTLADNIASLVSSAVIGRGALADPGAVPMVGTPGALVESALTDNGKDVALLRNIAAAAQPNIRFSDGVTVSQNRIGRFIAGDRYDLSYNLSYDGTNYNLDDITKAGTLVVITQTGLDVYIAPAGPNPVTGTLAGSIVAGGFKAAGTAGITATITTAKLTAGGATGSMTYKGGILTAQVQAT